MDPYLSDFITELKNRNYAFNTIKAYSRFMKAFIEYTDLHINVLPETRIRDFLAHQCPAPEQTRIALSAIKVFYAYVIKKDCPYNIKKIKRRKRLPSVLTRDEVLRLLAMISNTKHRMMISLMYASGLRLSEVVALKVKDLDLEVLSLHVRDSKQHKDRFTIISPKLVPELREMVRGRKPGETLFISSFQKRYAKRTLQLILEKARSRAELNKRVTCHTLRHSFATHLKESGVDIKSIQQLLGHKSIKTTMIYIHLADPLSRKIASPL